MKKELGLTHIVGVQMGKKQLNCKGVFGDKNLILGTSLSRIKKFHPEASCLVSVLVIFCTFIWYYFVSFRPFLLIFFPYLDRKIKTLGNKHNKNI